MGGKKKIMKVKEETIREKTNLHRKDQWNQELGFWKDKHNSKPVSERKKKEHDNKIKNERGEMKTNCTEIQNIIKVHYEQLCTNILAAAEESVNF